MIFKTDSAKEQYGKLPILLRHILSEFEEMCSKWGIDPVCTRVADAVCGDSGVHEVYRAADFRDEFEGKRVFQPYQIDLLTGYFNTKYARKDGRVTLLHHSFQGMPYHLHFQVAASNSQYKDQDAVQAASLTS